MLLIHEFATIGFVSRPDKDEFSINTINQDFEEELNDIEIAIDNNDEIMREHKKYYDEICREYL